MSGHVQVVIVLHTLKLYGDESADERKERVFVVAGVIGTDDEWAATVLPWVRRTRGRPVHANRIESEFVNDPDRQKHKGNLGLYKDLITVLANSPLVGFSVAMDLESMRLCMDDLLPDVAYYKCFSDLLGCVGRTAEEFNSSNADAVRLEFTFDSRIESDGTAGTVYTMFRTQPEWSDVSIFDTKVSFEGGDAEPRLEIADFLAREGMKELDRKLTHSNRPPRRSFLALDGARSPMGTKKFHFIEYDRRYCEEWRARVDDPAGQAERAGYSSWLYATGRSQNGRPVDTMSNRMLFAIWSANQQKVSSSGRRAASLAAASEDRLLSKPSELDEGHQ